MSSLFDIAYLLNITLSRVNNYVEGGTPLVDGYAPFCKHVFVPNFANVLCGYAAITPENERKLKVSYEARNENELPVLVTYFDKNEIDSPVATWLDVILYSRQQITEEYIAMNQTPPASSTPWSIISIKSQMIDIELPMQPITMYVPLRLMNVSIAELLYVDVYKCNCTSV